MKKLLLITLSLVMSFALVISCGGTPEPAPEPAPAPAPAPAPTPAPTPAPAPEPAPAPAPTPAPVSQDIILDGAQTYTVVAGDTLSAIARRFYGNGYYYPLIVLGSQVVEDIDVIEVGTRLTIPNLQRNLESSGPRSRIKSYISEVARINENRGRSVDAAELRKIADSL